MIQCNLLYVTVDKTFDLSEHVNSQCESLHKSLVCVMILDTAGHVRIVILLYIHVSNMESRCMDIVPKTHLMKLQNYSKLVTRAQP